MIRKVKKICKKIFNYYRFKAIIMGAKEALERGQYHNALMIIDELIIKKGAKLSDKERKITRELRREALRMAIESKIYNEILYAIQKLDFKDALTALDALEIYIAKKTGDETQNLFSSVKIEELVVKYATDNKITAWLNIKNRLPYSVDSLRKFICETGLHHEIVDVGRSVTPGDYKNLLSCVKNIRFYLEEGNLPIFDVNFDLEEMEKRAYHLGLIYELDQATNAFINAEEAAREIGFPPKEFELMRGKIECMKKGVVAFKLKKSENIKTVGC